MKNKTCGECRYYKNNRCMLPCYAINNWAEDPACHHFEKKTPPTIGDKIRQMSDEELAKKLVYKAEISETMGGLSYSCQGFVSTIIPDLYFEKESEAIAATIAELKKEWKE